MCTDQLITTTLSVDARQRPVRHQTCLPPLPPPHKSITFTSIEEQLNQVREMELVPPPPSPEAQTRITETRAYVEARTYSILLEGWRNR